MIQNYKIVTLCGSTRFKEQFIEAQKRLTLDGCIVISVGLFGHSGDEEVWKPGTKEMLDDMHLRKIDLADVNQGDGDFDLFSLPIATSLTSQSMRPLHMELNKRADGSMVEEIEDVDSPPYTGSRRVYDHWHPI